MDGINYYERLAAAYVRGHSLRTGQPSLSQEWKCRPLSELGEDSIRDIMNAGREAQLKMYRFKAGHEDMPRVRKVLGFLKGVSFESLLDVGSGRGVFLLPFLSEFPWVQATALDILPYRVEFLQDIAGGGVENLTAVHGDICGKPFADDSVDIVSMLEVLEHIPDVAAAVGAAVRIARKFVVVTVPSKEDNNPEHIHLLTKEKLTALFTGAGCDRLRFDGVNGHLIAVASMRGPEGGELWKPALN